ncbi:MAG: hypothetical protein H6835_00195 [Planctomycetes bacterium]|nr:hypothetical protein [Planctomycetota bacterium]
MSLFGTGRREGVTATLLVGALTVAAVFGLAMRGEAALGERLEVAALSLGGMLTYRFLRAIGRSRYAGFLGGLGYALAPILAGLAMRPRELWSAALAPLALEAAARCAHPVTRRTWLPWTGLLLAAPFAAGPTVIACTTAALAAIWFVRTALARDEDERAPLGGLLATTAIAGAASWQLVQLDPFGPLLRSFATPSALHVMAGLGAAPARHDPTAILGALGPLLTWFAAFGLLRGQRLARAWTWCPLLAIAAAAVVIDGGGLHVELPRVLERHAVTAVAVWAGLLAVLVLGTAGLDDFLDRPMRRRAAHATLFAATFALVLALPLLERGSGAQQFWVPVGSLLLLAVVSTTWRQLGVLRFKNLLTATALATLLAPLCFGVARNEAWNAAPLAERALRDEAAFWRGLLTRPLGDFGWLLTALGATAAMVIVQAQRRRRSHSAATAPTRAKAAIKKNASAPKRL